MNLALAEPLTEADVVGTWAGLRPLVTGGTVGQKTADLSRRHKVAASRSGLVTVTGGKLTTYRKMAEDTTDAVVRGLGRKATCRTKKLPLLGASGPAPDDEHLARRYGSLAAEILELADSDPDLAAPLVPGLPYRRAEAVYAVREEMATTLDDVLSRRTRARLLAARRHRGGRRERRPAPRRRARVGRDPDHRRGGRLPGRAGARADRGRTPRDRARPRPRHPRPGVATASGGSP